MKSGAGGAEVEAMLPRMEVDEVKKEKNIEESEKNVCRKNEDGEDGSVGGDEGRWQ